MNTKKPEIKTKKNYNFLTYFKFIGFSIFGVVLFFTPITINGTNSIPLDHLITYMNKIMPQLGPIVTFCIAIIGGILPWVDKSYKKTTATFILAIFKTIAIPLAIMAMFSLGPAWLLDPNMLPFVWQNIAVDVTVIVIIGSFFLTFITNSGFLDFTGIFMKPVTRSIFKVPGKAAVNAVASFVGSFSVGTFLTNRLYNEGEYTNKEASIIVTGFSTVSATFMIIVAKTAGLMDMWVFYFFSTLVITFGVTALVVRMWPLRSLDDTYVEGKEATKDSDNISGNIFVSAYEEGLDAAAESQSLYKALVENVKDGIRMTFNLTPSMVSIALLAFILVKMTPVFDIVGYIFAPVTLLLSMIGLSEPLMVAKAAAMVIGEMFVPNVVVSSLDMIPKYVIAVDSVAAVLFFGGSIPCIMATDLKIEIWQIVVVWFERTVLALIIATIVALLVF